LPFRRSIPTIFYFAAPFQSYRARFQIRGGGWRRFAKFRRPNPHFNTERLLTARVHPDDAIGIDAASHKIVFGTIASRFRFANSRRFASMDNEINNTQRPFFDLISDLVEMDLFVVEGHIAPLVESIRRDNQAILR